MELIRAMTAEYGEYLRDESRLTGAAEYIAFPKSEAEVVELVKYCAGYSLPINVQGARTGIAGGATPQGGLILNLSRMNKILGLKQDMQTGVYYIRVQPGLLLSQLRKVLENKSFDISGWSRESIDTLSGIKAGQLFFSPDPTETTASLGGMAACNASGARSLYYGATRRHVQAIRVVLADGSLTALERGVHKARGRDFALPLTDGDNFSGKLPGFDTPDVKDAGYYFRDNMDLADMFIGSQGTLGIITELELALMPAPKLMWGCTAFLPDDQSALRYIRLLRGEKLAGFPQFKHKPAAIEFFDKNAMKLFLYHRQKTPAFQQLPEPNPGFECAVYVEFNEQNTEAFWPCLKDLADLVCVVGGDPDNSWVANCSRELEKLLFFRHAVSESINLAIDENKKNEPNLTMLSADMATPGDKLEVYDIYKRDLEQSNLHWVIFGHAGENHFHPNILARNMNEMEQGHRLFAKWAKDISDLGGSISAEHGAGKIKVKLARIMYGDERLQKLHDFKLRLDPLSILGPGNIFA